MPEDGCGSVAVRRRLGGGLVRLAAADSCWRRSGGAWLRHIRADGGLGWRRIRAGSGPLEHGVFGLYI